MTQKPFHANKLFRTGMCRCILLARLWHRPTTKRLKPSKPKSNFIEISKSDDTTTLEGFCWWWWNPHWGSTWTSELVDTNPHKLARTDNMLTAWATSLWRTCDGPGMEGRLRESFSIWEVSLNTYGTHERANERTPHWLVMDDPSVVGVGQNQGVARTYIFIIVDLNRYIYIYRFFHMIDTSKHVYTHV